MKKFFIFASCVAALISATGCHPEQQKGQATPTCDTIVAEAPLEVAGMEIFGTYCGTFPCADCSGKQIELSIMEDDTYLLSYEYLDTDSGIREECGTYSIINDSIIETVTPSSGEKTYYVYVHGNLILSDSLGTINHGELADFYVLKKDTVTVD